MDFEEVLAEETIRYTERHGSKASYHDIVEHLIAYRDRFFPNLKVSGWIFNWVACLTGKDWPTESNDGKLI